MQNRRTGEPGTPEPETRSARSRSGGARSHDRRSPRDGRRPRLQGEPVQSRHAGAASAGLGVQAVRVCRGPRSRLLAVFARDAARRAYPDPAGRMDSRRRTFDSAGDDGARGAAHVQQSRRRSDARGGWHRQDGGSGAQDGDGKRAERAVARARFRRGHADGDDVGLCRLCRSRDSCGPAMFIRRVEDADGTVLFEAKPVGRASACRRRPLFS